MRPLSPLKSVVGVGVSLALALSLAAVTPLESAAAVGVSSVVKGPIARPDRVSAMSTAHARGVRVEDESQRTPTTVTFANPDGSWTTEAYAGVVRAAGEGEGWVPVDADVRRGDGAYEPAASPLDLRFSDGGDRTVGAVDTVSGASFAVAWPTPLPAPAVADDTLTYSGAAAGGGDLVVTSQVDGFNFSVVLDAPPAADAAPVEYRVPIKTDGAEPVFGADGSILLKDGRDRVLSMTAPVMWDGQPANAGGAGEKLPIGAAFEGTGPDRTLVLRPDMDFLLDPDTVYPVTVDPSIVVNTAGDTWVQSAGDTSSQVNSTELRVGSSDGGVTVARSLVYFDLSGLSQPANAVFSSAALRMSNFAAGSCSGSAVSVSRITAGWTLPSVTWASQPGVTTAGAGTSSAAFGASGCDAEGTVSFDVSGIAQDWAAGAWNVGVLIKASDETAASGFRKFRSLENGDLSKVPQLVLNYNAAPDVPAGAVQVTPGASSGSTVFTSSNTPTFTTSVSDPDGGNITAQFQLLQGATVVHDWTSGSLPSGSAVSRTLPTAVADGSYTARWRTDDGTSNSAWSAGQAVVVDTVKPSPPTITCTGNAAYANNAWTATGAGTASCMLAVTGDAVAVTALRDDQDVSLPDLSSGSTSKSFPVAANDFFRLEAAAVDAAGNTSTAASYRFAIGGGSLQQPAPGATSTGAFAVRAIGRGGASTAQVQWRAAGATSWTTATKVTKAGAAWTGAVTADGSFSTTGELLWNAATEPSVTVPSTIEVRVCSTYSIAPTSLCTAQSAVSLVRHAFGENYPVASAGPASVALMTGEFSVDVTDVSVPGYADTLEISRSSRSFATAPSPWQSVFGPGWIANFDGPSVGFSAAQVIDRTATDGTIVLVDTDGESSVYGYAAGGTPVAQQTGYYKARGLAVANNDRLDLIAGTPKTLALTEEDGTKTTWAYANNGVWNVRSVVDPTQTIPATRFIYTGSYLTSILTQAPGITDTNCSATVQVPGCRALVLSYTGTGSATRLSQVDLKTFNPKPRTADSGTAGEEAGTPGSPAGMVSIPVAKYGYDASGRLTSAWDPRLDYNSGANSVATSYSYQTAVGQTILASLTPPGEKAWNFNLDASGRLDTVTRTQDAAVGGTATWKIAYSVPLSGAGLPSMTATEVAKWGQTQVPNRAAAVFGPDAPAPYTDYTYADLTYFTSAGQTVNSGTFGAGAWLIDTTQYDTTGQVTWSLDATNRALGLFDYGWAPSAIQNHLTTKYVYSPEGDRLEQESEPNRNVVLRNGNTVYGRVRTVYKYDDQIAASDPSLVPGRPTTNAVPRRNLVVSTTKDVIERSTGNVSAVQEATVNYYNPSVAGDGDGWKLGRPTRVSVQQDSSTWATSVNRFDTQGRTIGTRTPQGVGGGTNYSANDTRSSYTIYYSPGSTGPAACQNKPEWADQVCMTGPGDGAGTPVPSTASPTTVTTGYDYLGNPTRSVVTNTAGNVARASVTTYDLPGRVTTETTTTSNAPTGETATPATSYTYDPPTGRLTSTTRGSASTSTSYDTWGRALTVTDGAGNAGVTTYDAAGRVKTLNDGKGTYTYTYDGTDAAGKVERRGMITSLKTGLASGPDIFTAAYDTDGNQVKLTYPNGIVASSLYDAAGNQLRLVYSNAGTDIIGFSAYTDASGKIRVQQSVQAFTWFDYDLRGRLTEVRDSYYGQCTTRRYAFSLDSNRTSLTSNAPAADGSCSTTSTATTTGGTFDADDRKTDTGYVYDTTGRTTTLPGADISTASDGAVDVAYFADDMVALLTQGSGSTSKSKTYSLDTLGRISTISEGVGGTELRRSTNQFADGGDSPAWISQEVRADGSSTWTSSWTRNVMAPTGDLGMVQSSDGSSRIQLTNMHGDIVATLPNTSYAGLQNYSESTEYGSVRDVATSLQQSYAWLGGKRRSGDALGGFLLMGVRLYNSATGRFLTRDPVAGGNDNSYTYPVDPVNDLDLNGMWSLRGALKKTGKWIKKHKTDIILTAAAFAVPGGGAALVMGVRAYRTAQVIRKVKIGKDFAASRSVTIRAAKKWVGKGYREGETYWKGRRIYSADKARQYRYPSVKSGRNYNGNYSNFNYGNRNVHVKHWLY